MIQESSSATLGESEIDHIATNGEASSNSALENAAVESYLAELPGEGGYITPEDVEVATVPVNDQISAVMVAPEHTVSVQALDIIADASTDEISAGADIRLVADEWQTAGPGMGSWPSWYDVNSYVVEIRLYWDKPGADPNYIGKANFQTQRRKYRDDTSLRDLWQVARRARATPDEIEQPGTDDSAYVKRLWISSRLDPAAAPYSQQWRQDLTNPDEGFSQCDSGSVEVAAGPFAFVASNCEDYNVWQGDVGHYRFDYDQGTWAGGEGKAIAYVSGFQMDNNRAAVMDWYQFVSLRMGHITDGSPTFKCTETSAGYSTSTQVTSCTFD